MSSEDETELLREIAQQISIQNDKIRSRTEKNELQQRVQRSENAHLLVSLGVLSGLITYHFQEGLELQNCIFEPSGASCAILLTAAISVMYLPGKLLVVTLRPVVDHSWLRKTNDVVLPSFHVFLFISMIPLLLILLLAPEFRHKYFSIKYIALALILSSVPAYSYASRYRKAMEKIRTTSTRRNIIVTSSYSESDGKIRLTNPNSRPIPNDDVVLSIEKPSDVSVELRQTISGNKTNERKPATDIPANNVMDLPVSINPIPGHSDVAGEVVIEIEIPGQQKQVEYLSYGLGQDHSGTTNIG